MHIAWTRLEDQRTRGQDEEGNTYIMTSNLETCSVKTPDGFKGQGWTPEEALWVATDKKRSAATEKHNHTLQALTGVARDLVSAFDGSKPLSLDELGQDINDTLADTPTACVPFFCAQLVRAAMLRGAMDAQQKIITALMDQQERYAVNLEKLF